MLVTRHRGHEVRGKGLIICVSVTSMRLSLSSITVDERPVPESAGQVR